MSNINHIIQTIEKLGEESKTVSGVTKNIKELFANITEEEKQTIMKEISRRRIKYTEKQKSNLANINFFIANITCKTKTEIQEILKKEKEKEKEKKRNKPTKKVEEEQKKEEETKPETIQEETKQQIKNEYWLSFTIGDEVYDIVGTNIWNIISMDKKNNLITSQNNDGIKTTRDLSILVLPIEETCITNDNNIILEIGKQIYSQDGTYLWYVQSFVTDGRYIYSIYEDFREWKNKLLPIDTLGNKKITD